MKYKIEYQFMLKGHSRPLDEVSTVIIEANDKGGLVIIPNVGDYVNIVDETTGQETSQGYQGKVRSRLFNYHKVSEDINWCMVNIVIEETDDDFGRLLKM